MGPILPLVKRIADRAKTEGCGGRLEKFFIFSLSNRKFAIPAVDVTEVRPLGKLMEVPNKLDLLSGVLNIRGNIVPVLNMRERLGLPSEFEINDESRLILFTLSEKTYAGMVAEKIQYRLREGVVRPLPVEIDVEKEKPVKTALIDNEKYVVFMLDMWLNEDEVEILQNLIKSF